MRLSASRIRSINRAIARVQSSAWSASGQQPCRSSSRFKNLSVSNATAEVLEDRRGPERRSGLSKSPNMRIKETGSGISRSLPEI